MYYDEYAHDEYGYDADGYDAYYAAYAVYDDEAALFDDCEDEALAEYCYF